MTREKAAKIISDYDINFGDLPAEEIAEACEKGVKALRTLEKIDKLSAQYILLNRELVPEEEEDEQTIGYQRAMMRIRKIIVEGE